MKLSEAIRLGAMLKPQGYGNSSLTSPDATCALGAACDAVGAASGLLHRYGAIVKAWPWVETLAICPRCEQAATHRQIIWHLNDNYHWTREQIAEWVASQEALTEPEAVAAVRLSVEQPIVSLRA